MNANIKAAEKTYVEGMTNQQFVERFSDLVFGENREHQLSKFLGPIRITLKGSDPKVVEQYRPKIEQATAKLREAAGIDIAIRQGEEKANYAYLISETPVFDMLVTISDIAKFFAANDEDRFYEDVKAFEQKQLIYTTKFIALDSSELKGCLSIQKAPPLINGESFMNTEISLLYCLGLKRHLFENDEFSVRTNNFKKTRFSKEKTSYKEFDIAALKVLYHEKLTVGLNFQQAKDIIEDIVINSN